MALKPSKPKVTFQASWAESGGNAGMLIELRVEQNGKTIFRAECDTERGGSFAQFSKSVLTKFKQEHPEVSLLDDNVWLKFDVVR